MVALGEILFSRTLWTAPSRFQWTFGRAAKVLLWNWYRLWPAWTPALPRAWRSENYASRSTSGYKYKNHLGSFQQNSCHRNATRRGPQTATIVFDIYTCGIGDFQAQVFFPAPPKNLPSKHHESELSKQLPSLTLLAITVDIAKKFVHANEQRKRHFGKYE